jgi:anti-sigma-K factor RskA
VGTATVVLPPLVPGIAAKAFGVTVEKAGGSDSPTSPIILSGATSGS